MLSAAAYCRIAESNQPPNVRGRREQKEVCQEIQHAAELHEPPARHAELRVELVTQLSNKNRIGDSD